MAQCFNSLADLERYVADALGAEGAPVDEPPVSRVCECRQTKPSANRAKTRRIFFRK